MQASRGEGMPQDRTAGRVRGGRKISRSNFRRAALCGAVAAAAVCGPYSMASAGDSDISSNQSFSDKVLNTLGLHNPFDTQYEINYSERSPLVVPPTRDLPKPELSTAKPVPNWPTDPEITKRHQAKDDEKVTPRPYDSVMNSSRALTPTELGVGRVTPAVPTPGVGEQSTPSDLGQPKKSFFNFDWTKKEEYGTFTGEPPRVSLTDPPPGYQTPSPDQPYGIVPEHKVYKPPSLGERMEPTR
jgi:hypothetical protein